MSKWKGLLYMGKDLSDYFLINSKGELLNKKTGRILKYSINNQTGYLQVCVSMGSRKSKKIIKKHVALACTFLEGYKEGLVVNHKDGIKTNNNLSNLEWVTCKENSEHASRNGLLNQNGSKKFSKVMCINTGEIFESSASAARKYNLKSPSNIFDVCNGRKKCAGIDENGTRLEWKYA